MDIWVRLLAITGKGVTMELQELWNVNQEIDLSISYWTPRNTKMKEWMEILWLIDKLRTTGMETYVSNEPQTFYNMAHFLLTRGEISHMSSIQSETAIDLDKRAKVDRACKYMWTKVDRERQESGEQPFVQELGFFLLVSGWYSVVMAFEEATGLIKTKIWNPADVFPMYGNNRLISCVHRYTVTQAEAMLKAQENGWNYQPPAGTLSTQYLDTEIIDFFKLDSKGNLNNVILINRKPVTEWVSRPNMKIIVSPVSGFPDRGSITPSGQNWKELAGRSIFNVNQGVTTAMNKWKSMVSQILRDTAQPVTQEFSQTPQATPEQLRERGAHFHYAPGELGLQRVAPPAIPLELQAHMISMNREEQKGSLNDAVYGMLEGQAGYALSLLSSSSANQILAAYMDAKHFVLSTGDRFWLNNLKRTRRVFEVKGKFDEKLKPTDILPDVEISVESDVATPKDWLERATIAGMMDKHVDLDTILTEIYRIRDTQGVKRKMNVDKMMNHPMTEQLELISSYEAHAKFLDYHGDPVSAKRYRKAAMVLEAQLSGQPEGEPPPAQASRVAAQRNTPESQGRQRVNPSVSPPENQQAFSPQQLRQSVGRGKVRTV